MTTEVQWSELQRDPKSVAALADQGDVRVRRRDGVPLLLVREDRASVLAEGSMTAARALRNALAHLSPDGVLESLVEEFPWVGLLPDDDQRLFAVDFVRAVQASAELGQWNVLSQVLAEWKATAAIHADSVLVADLSRPIDMDLGPVPSPDGS
jgi:hypothetical protein